MTNCDIRNGCSSPHIVEYIFSGFYAKLPIFFERRHFGHFFRQQLPFVTLEIAKHRSPRDPVFVHQCRYRHAPEMLILSARIWRGVNLRPWRAGTEGDGSVTRLWPCSGS